MTRAAEPSAEGGTPSSARRAGFAGTLALAMAVSTFAQYALGALGPFVIRDLSLSLARFGALSTALFVVGGVCSAPAGRVVDWLGGRRVLVATFAVAGAAFAGMGVAPGYGWLLAAVGLSGVALAASNPVTNKLIAAHAAPGRQGVVTGFKQSGVQFGAALAGGLPAAASVLGWRGALALAIVLVAAGLMGTALFVPSDAPGDDVEGVTGGRVGATVWWLTGYAFLMGIGVSAVSAYLPQYSVQRVGFATTLAGLAAGLVGAVGVAARIAWGYWLDRIGHVAGSLAVLAGCSVVAQTLILAAEAGGGWLLWAGAVGFGATAVAWNAVGMLAVVREGRQDAGRASGIVLVGFYCGFVVSPVAFGAVVDATRSYTLAWGACAVAFALAAVAAAVWWQLERGAGRHG